MSDHVSELAAERRMTPMMRQYLEAKAEHPDAILMFRMGDFYEMFLDDARIAAKELDLVLTSREKDRGDGGIPMAGVPHHAVSSYIAKLVERGHTVAVCDQVEDPRKAKGLVRREITRLVTPGTQSDLDALDPASASYVACVAPAAGAAEDVVLAMLDLLAGEVVVTRCPADGLADELRRMGAREIITAPEDRERVTGILGEDAPAPLRAPELETSADSAVFLRQRLGTGATEGLPGGDGDAALPALERLVRFAETTQRRVLKHLMPPRAYRAADSLVLDESTRRNLELVATQIDNERHGSLLWHLDRCATAMGSRLLRHWLLFPLRDLAVIAGRLDAVELLATDRPLREAVQQGLDGVRDVERLLGRVAVGRAVPRDLGALRASLCRVPEIQARLAGRPSYLGERWSTLDGAADVRELLDASLVDEPPLTAGDGGIFRRGFRDDLDELISLSTEGHDFLVDLERRERARTGIANLKVRYNKVFGYYIEVTKANLAQVPADYVRKQTLVGAERFITGELKEYEDRVLHADERRKQREAELFEELVARIAAQAPRLRAISRLVAETDALASLGEVADEERYVRPELCAEPVVELAGSRHPVIERLMPGGERFVPNDIRLDARGRQLVIITGPNMAGKSTVMRQVALATVMAHMGSFVPAKRARIGLCDRVFTRVGAADNLGRGRSTFMVEMIETATILRQATCDSLVLLDEIGRGTSTFDGLSIAWAVAEHLHDEVGCRAMFATHYHELTELALERPRIVNASVAVKEHEERIVFLRHLVDGPANHSYGIQVAQLAGVPDTVLGRAREVLANLEAGALDERGMPFLASSRAAQQQTGQLSLFARPKGPSEVERALAELEPLELTPMQALVELDRLKKLLAKKGPPG